MSEEDIKKEVIEIITSKELISSDVDWKYSKICELIDKVTLAERERCVKEIKLTRSAFAGRLGQARYDRGTGVIALSFFDAAIDSINQQE